MEGITFRNWWIIALKGILSIALGVITITSQDMVAGRFVFYFSFLLFALGVLGVYIGIHNMVRSSSWSIWLIEGVSSALLGGVILAKKILVAAFLIDFVIGFWLITVCIQPIVFLFRYFRESRNLYIWIYIILLLIFGITLIFGFIQSFYKSGNLYGNISSYMVAGLIVSVYGGLTLVLAFEYKRLPL